jgi:hypothetical protein
MFGQEIPWNNRHQIPNWYRCFDAKWPFCVSVSSDPDGSFFAYVLINIPVIRNSHSWTARDTSASRALAKVARKIRRDIPIIWPSIRLAAALAGMRVKP